MKTSVLFVCLGNICRSPAAEGVLRHLVNVREVQDQVRIDSAGTIAFHQGDPADRRMRSAAAVRGYPIESRSRPVEAQDFYDFQWIVAMDRTNLHDLKRFQWQQARVVLFSHFLDDHWPEDVPDPYFGGAQGFEMVLDMLEAGCPKLLSVALSEEAHSAPQ